MRFAFMLEEKAHFPIAFMCRHLEVSRSGFHAWSKRPESERARADRSLTKEIAAVHEASRKTYGSPRVHAELNAKGRAIGRRRVARLMRAEGICARRKRRWKRTTDSAHGHPVAPNVLERDFSPSEPNRTWATDITYVWTREGWLYLAVVLDLFSRMVVGWAMSKEIDRLLVLGALDMALIGRAPPPSGLVHHSDRGSQYASGDYRRALESRGITASMSRKGNCWDNAVAESFFSSLKMELVFNKDFTTRAEATSSIFEYIEVFYNRQRRHSSLGYVSPTEYEKSAASAGIAA
jgi:putative transposase